jgi:hypothetical protein
MGGISYMSAFKVSDMTTLSSTHCPLSFMLKLLHPANKNDERGAEFRMCWDRKKLGTYIDNLERDMGKLTQISDILNNPTGMIDINQVVGSFRDIITRAASPFVRRSGARRSDYVSPTASTVVDY